MLPVSADSGFRGFRLGLDYRAQEVRGQLLFRRVSNGVPAEVSAHASRPADQQNGHVPGHRAVLRAPQNDRHIDVVFRPGLQHHLRPVTRHGGGTMRLQLRATSSSSSSQMHRYHIISKIIFLFPL